MRFGLSDKNEFARAVLKTASVAVACFSFAATCYADPSPTSPSNDSIGSTEDSNLEPLLKGLKLGLNSSDWSGDFGAGKSTNIAATLANVTYSTENLRLYASVPWMRIDSPGAVFTGIEGTPLIADPGALQNRKIRQGLGDLTLGASYLLPSTLTGSIDTDLSLRVKAPTASGSGGLSTGKVDYSLGSTFSKPIGRFAPLISVFYRSFGSGPQFQLKNGFATSLGTSYAFSPKSVILLTYDYAQRASQYIADSHQITASVTAMLPNSPVRLTSFLAGGLSKGAAAVSVGLAFSLRL